MMRLSERAPMKRRMVDPYEGKALPWPFRAFGAFCIAGSFLYSYGLALNAASTAQGLKDGTLTVDGVSDIVVTVIHLAVLIALVIAFVVLGVRLITEKRRHAALAANIIALLLLLDAVCSIMLEGVSVHLVVIGSLLVLAVAFGAYADPALAQERKIDRRLRSLEERDEQRAGILGRDETGRGYISLNFFNLFWIFVVCSMLGLALETTFHLLQYHAYQDRAGLLFGPFSPIYGVGAVLMTLALNRFYKSNPLVIFLVSALIGGTFEYFTSWFMQIAFGAVAWNYTGMWLSIGGRTCGLFMCIWGLLGLVWIKLLLPLTLRVVNLIPWNWRYWLTVACALLMAVNIVMSLQALDCWHERLSDKPTVSPIQQFYAEHFDNEFMADRFQTMTIHGAD